MTERIVYRMYVLGRNFVSGLICALKAKKVFKKSKNLKTSFKNLVFFQPCCEVEFSHTLNVYFVTYVD